MDRTNKHDAEDEQRDQDSHHQCQRHEPGVLPTGSLPLHSPGRERQVHRVQPPRPGDRPVPPDCGGSYHAELRRQLWRRPPGIETHGARWRTVEHPRNYRRLRWRRWCGALVRLRDGDRRPVGWDPPGTRQIDHVRRPQRRALGQSPDGRVDRVDIRRGLDLVEQLGTRRLVEQAPPVGVHHGGNRTITDSQQRRSAGDVLHESTINHA